MSKNQLETKTQLVDMTDLVEDWCKKHGYSGFGGRRCICSLELVSANGYSLLLRGQLMREFLLKDAPKKNESPTTFPIIPLKED